MTECTRGRKRKESHYVGSRKKLPKPLIVSIKSKDENGKDIKKQITYAFQNVLSKAKAALEAGAVIEDDHPKVEQAAEQPKEKVAKKKTTKTEKAKN